MGNLDLSCIEAYGRFKTARRKKQLQRGDKEKQLIQLSRKQDALWKAKRALPIIPLEQPYQKGWVRSFVLREDVAKTKDADFYQGILDKINTESFSSIKSFKVKRKRFGKKVFETAPQYLKDFWPYEWLSPKNPLSDKEKERFFERVMWSKKRNIWVTVHSFHQPWRFVLKVKPNMITHTQMIDGFLEQEIRKIENYLTSNNLNGKMERLTKSRKSSGWSYRKLNEKSKYESLTPLLEEYWENRIEQS